MATNSDDLAARIQRLEDEQAVIARLHEVTYAVDGPDEAAWLDQFTDTGAFSWRAKPDADRLLDLHGRDELKAWFGHHRQQNLLGTQMHIVLHPMVTVEGDTATATTAYQTLRLVEGQIVTASTGQYEDRLARCADGKWRLEDHQAIGTMMRQPTPTKG